MDLDLKKRKEKELIQNIVDSKEEIQDLILRYNIKNNFSYEDEFYRFYHQSYKVYELQSLTKLILSLLEKIKPSDTKLNNWFKEIIKDGTDKKFKLNHNKEWLKHTRPILEAFFHAYTMLQLINKYGLKLKNDNQDVIYPGWGAVLYLYNIR